MLAAAADATTIEDHFEAGFAAMLDGFEFLRETPRRAAGSPQHR